MTLEIKIALLVVLVATTSWFLVGKLIASLTRRNIVDHPNERTLHQGAVPRGGGLVIITALILSLVFMAASSSRPIFFVALACLCMGWACLSWWDDKHDLSPKIRLIIQVLLSVLTISAFGWVSQLAGLSLGYFGAFISLIGVLWMANLYNFMDGLDGFAGTQTIIASSTLSFWFFISGDSGLALVCLILAAASYGFVLHNWSPARVFMGDVGSITLGAFFGTLIIIGSTRHDISVLSFIGLFAVFVGDTSITIIRRAIKGEKIWLPHRQHFYQRLANAGYSHSYIALGAAFFMIICSLLATLSVAYHDMIALSILAIVITLICAICLVLYFEKKAVKYTSGEASK